MKYILALIATATLSACVPDNYPVTIPPGAQLCRTDYDCSINQYCGFTTGYSAAVCQNGSAQGFRLNPR